jgi:Protein of unknown function DUF262
MNTNIDDLENDDLADDSFNSIEATEEMESETSKSEIKSPFDPRLIKITREASTIYNLAMRIKEKGIDLYPEFQRKGNLWKPDRQSRLIESLLLRFPLPAFYFNIEQDEKGDDKWLVVDGLQRLSTIKNFIVDNSLILEGLEILKDYEGVSFKKLDATLRRRILETNVTIFFIQPGTPKEVKYNIFKRINTGGLVLTPMEIRHALNQKNFAGHFLRDLTEGTGFFKQFLVQNKITNVNRMEDRELLLRYVGFKLTPYNSYEPSLSNFLDIAMEKLDEQTKDSCNNLERQLEKAIDIYKKLFDNKRFGRTLTSKCRINSALFEAWTSSLGQLTDEEHQNLIHQKEDIKREYQNLLNDKDFQKSFTLRTSNKTAVITRFSRINTLIQSFLHD